MKTKLPKIVGERHDFVPWTGEYDMQHSSPQPGAAWGAVRYSVKSNGQWCYPSADGSSVPFQAMSYPASELEEMELDALRERQFEEIAAEGMAGVHDDQADHDSGLAQTTPDTESGPVKAISMDDAELYWGD